MELGQKIRQARLEAGMSQRQLCGEEITRNMLSQIENGSAKPSMQTLRYFAQRLGKSVSWFLEEDVVQLPNREALEQARSAYSARDYEKTMVHLRQCQLPDPVFGEEIALLTVLASLARAEEELQAGRIPLVRYLLDQAETRGRETVYYSKELQHRLLLCKARTDPGNVKLSQKEPGVLDQELLILAREAMEQKDDTRCDALLESVWDKSGEEWQLLRGELYFAQGEYDRAVACLSPLESVMPERVLPKLEESWGKLRDYQKAYHYACLRREIGV